MTWTPDMADPTWTRALGMACCPWSHGLPDSYATDRDAPASPLATPQAKSNPAGEDKT